MTPTPERERLQDLQKALEARHTLLKSVRSFFEERDFLEVDTPIRIPCPALERHIDAEPSGALFLRTSPELHMKRLLGAGYEQIFQVGPCFRQGEQGALHHPEYTMLEWYRTHADYTDLLTDTKALVAHVAEHVAGSTTLTQHGEPLDLLPVWEVKTVQEAFLDWAGWDPIADFDPDRFDQDLVDKVEPSMPRHVPFILKDYPAQLGALARLKPDNPSVAERWELYLGGVEIANAYSELVDLEEQRQRFEDCARERASDGKPNYPVDQDFLNALEHGLPPCAGIALGIDRLLMVLLDAGSLDEVLPFRDEEA